eukprot:TRINITY_DN5346_c1_g1_i1.p1 TRINITY_DN5346_c1_g1~~TRINITY_DN5346_c1_g1_i1.p1  ORF type:complete len:334 (+),score=85.90 TRINITY_DN5346_c1_g1_i1:116-1003(+)
MDRLGDPVVTPIGPQSLKGLEGPVDVCLFLPQQLAARTGAVSVSVPSPAACPLRPRQRQLAEAAWPASPGAGPMTTRSVMRQGLLQRTATVACFRATPDADLTSLGSSLAELLEVVEMAADTTQGVLVSTISAQCVVVWNGPRACDDHYSQCLCATDVVRRTDGISAGACSGVILYGNVAGGRKKHSTVAGGCVDLAAALAEEAEATRSYRVLAATTFAHYCSTQRRTFRCCVLRLRGVSGGTVTVSAVADSDEVVSVRPPPDGEGVRVVVAGAGVETDDVLRWLPSPLPADEEE